MNKTRKHPNFFDILIIVLLILAAGAAWFISHRSGSARDGQEVLRTYTLELNDLDQSAADIVAVGDTVTDNIRNYEIGTVTAVESGPDLLGVVDEENAILRLQPSPDRIKLIVTVECPTVETEKEITTDTGYTLRTGTSVSVTIGKLTAGGYILQLDR